MIISLQNTAKFHVISPRNVCSHAAATRSFKFMIFITFENRDKTCSKIEKNWFLLVHRVTKNSKMNKKILEVVVRKCSVKKTFLRVFQNSKENICAGDLFKKS